MQQKCRLPPGCRTFY